MKTLAKILGIAALSLIGCSLNAQYQSFVKENYDKYLLKANPIDVNNDSIPEMIAAEYDFNSNGKADAYAFFIIMDKDTIDKNKNGIIYHVRPKACMLVLDKDEDDQDYEYFIDSDLDGIFDITKNVKHTSMI